MIVLINPKLDPNTRKYIANTAKFILGLMFISLIVAIVALLLSLEF